jgi:hypothetical protein
MSFVLLIDAPATRPYILVLARTLREAEGAIEALATESRTAVWSDDPGFPEAYAARYGPPKRTVNLLG